jgi:hypothetical protein
MRGDPLTFRAVGLLSAEDMKVGLPARRMVPSKSQNQLPSRCQPNTRTAPAGGATLSNRAAAGVFWTAH